MLKLLRINNIALIPSLELELGPGLTLLTGETGAGKSILVDALALALGERADYVDAGGPEALRAAVAYVAGMTDRYAYSAYRRHVDPMRLRPGYSYNPSK